MNIEPPKIQTILRSQKEYRTLIAEFTKSHNIDDLGWNEIAYFMDEVRFFWLSRLDAIEVELEKLTRDNLCVLLSGAIYLNVADNEHFYFKALGDCHIVDDPFLRMEHFFRIAQESIDTKDIIDYFHRVILDNIEVLDNCHEAFLILPIRLLAIEDEETHYELLNDFFLRFLSGIFGKDYVDQESFCGNFTTFEEIEDGLEPQVRQFITFNRFEEEGLSLRKKIELHNEPKSYTQIMDGKPEAEIFFVTLFSYLSQITDILLTCSVMRLHPYIRYEVTFRYLVLIMNTFIDDEKLREMVENAIVFYIFRQIMDGLFDFHGSFQLFCKTMSEKRALPEIISSMRQNETEIFSSGVQEVADIVRKVFADEISRLTELGADAKPG